MAKQDDRPDRIKPIFWVASSRRDIRKLPKSVRSTFGQALFDAQKGSKHPDAKPLKGFGGSGTMEIVEDDNGSTYRAVYSVRFGGVVYVLHAFQKKSKSGSKTPSEEIEKARKRLTEAENHYAEWIGQEEQEKEKDT